MHISGTRSTAPLLLAAGLFLAAGCQDKHPEPVATPPPVVEVARPLERTVTDYDVFTARTQAVQSVNLKARVTGYLMKIDFKDGAVVEAGQVLFEIDNRPYKAALDKAKADEEIARAALAKAQAFYDIGLNVQKNDANAISTQELDKRKGSRDEAAGNLDQTKAVLKNAQLNYDWCKVTAPIAGLTDRHFVDVGNLVTQDVTPLTNIVSQKPTWAYFDVDQNAALRYQELVQEGKVKSARQQEIPVEMALGESKLYSFAGVIDFVSNQLDPNTGSIRLRAVFPNDDGKLEAGLFGRIRVPTSAPHPALLVADAAVGAEQGGRYVLVVNDSNVVESRTVDVGQVHGRGLREVLRTRQVIDIDAHGQQVVRQVEVLRPTDRVVVQGLQRARPNTTVDPRLVDMLTMLPATDSQNKSSSSVKSK
jgi:RND family efflux transporter MFP subunit